MNDRLKFIFWLSVKAIGIPAALVICAFYFDLANWQKAVTAIAAAAISFFIVARRVGWDFPEGIF